MLLSDFEAWATIFVNVCTPFAIAIGLWQFAVARHQQADERRFAIYNQINDQYVQFVELCVRHDWVDCFDISCATLMERHPMASEPAPRAAEQDRMPGDLDPRPRSAREARIEGATFAALISLLERAYVFYQETLPDGDPMVEKQWKGWLLYAEAMAKRERFSELWKDLGAEFDSDFADWMRKLMNGASK